MLPRIDSDRGDGVTDASRGPGHGKAAVVRKGSEAIVIAIELVKHPTGAAACSGLTAGKDCLVDI